MKKFICLFTVALLLTLNVRAEPTVSAKSAALINADTGEIIWSSNPDERLPMASTTKIMTAFLLCEMADLNKEIVVTKEMVTVEGSSMGLLPGDRVTYHDLLYGMLLASGNDAANVTAISLGGTVSGFAKMMNNKAAELGLKNTHFVTPSGLDADEHYTTARELALLAAEALKNKEFALAAASKTATLCYGNPPYKRTLTNHNRLLKSYEFAIGVKTGFTKKSGRCLVSAAEKDGKRVVAVTLNDPNDWQDHTALLEYGLESIIQTNYLPKTSGYNLPVVGGTEDNLLISLEPYTVNTLETEKISCKVCLPKLLYAPVQKGETIGSVEYKIGQKVIAILPIKASYSIAKSAEKINFWQSILKNIKYILINI